MRDVLLAVMLGGSLLTLQPAAATGLVEAWAAAREHDPEFAAARAAAQAGEARREQGRSLWRPSVALSGTAGVGASDTSTRGAQFSAPRFGTSQDVAFDTSVNRGAAARLALTASLPLISRDRRVQSRQLELAADVSALQWQAAQQALMLRTAQRYFDLAVAEETLAVLRAQQAAVERSRTEVEDRYRLGDTPVTDTHEAAARAQAIKAEVLAAETELVLRRRALADATGLPESGLQAQLPAGRQASQHPGVLEQWLSDASANNLELRMQQVQVELAGQDAARHSPGASASLDLVAQVGRDHLKGSGDYGTARNSAGNALIGLQLTVPLYTGGMRSARQQEALQLAERARAEFDARALHVAQQTRAAWLGLQTGTAREAALAEALKASEARLESTRLGHQVGDRTTLELLGAQNDAAHSRLAVTQARIGLLMDRLRLAALAGRLDEAQLRGAEAALRADTPEAR